MYKDVILTKLRVAIVNKVGGYLNDVNVDIVADAVAEAFKIDVMGFVWGEKVDRKLVFEYPATWWQMFKQQYFPEWLLKRVPVKMKRKYVDIYALYPDLKLEVSDKRGLKNYEFGVFWKEANEDEE